MIISLSGLHGTGKSVVAKTIAEKLNKKYYSTGEAFRDLANDKNMSLEEFTLYVDNHPKIDNELDQKIIDIAKKGNIVVESQLSGHLLKEIANLKVLLSCPLEIRVKRMADRDQTTYEEKLNETLIREKSERERFKILYNIDLGDEEGAKVVYDLIVDTKDITVEEVIEKIISEIKKL
jgi:cytidylate kinase